MRFDAHEIAPGLWMGSQPPVGHQLAARGFDIVVLCAVEYQPGAEWFPGVSVARITLDDARLSGGDALKSFTLGSEIAKEIKNGKTALVTCRQGRNRSGLVTALTLTQLTGCSGLSACMAIMTRRRSPFGPVLSNESFVNAISEIPEMGVTGPVTEHAARAARLAG